MTRIRAPRTRAALAATALLMVALAGCGDDDEASSSSTASSAPGSSTEVAGPGGGPETLVFNGQGNNLDAYSTGDLADLETQRVFETVETDPEGRDINAQICFLPPGEYGERLFIAGEDTGQEDPNRPAGWGLFRLDGSGIGDLSAEQVGKLETTFQPSNDDPENYGCGLLPDGRVLTTDVGNQAEGDGDGQLIIWFPPFTGGSYPDFPEVAHCKLDVTLPTAQSILVRGDTILVAAARGDVYLYTGPFPTGDDAAHGCGQTDVTGAPMADSVTKTTFIDAGDHGLGTPAGLAPTPDGGVYVSSVFSGVINEYGPDGEFVRTILGPPAGESLGEEPFSTGTPLGLGVTPDGTLYYADIGVVVTADSVGPGEATGTLRRILFVDGEPQAPETLASDLEFPDGIGVFIPVS